MRYTVFGLLACLSSLLGTGRALAKIQPPDQRTPVHEPPSDVGVLYLGDEPVCTASANAGHFVTAAHCIVHRDVLLKHYAVKLGSRTYSVQREVKRFGKADLSILSSQELAKSSADAAVGTKPFDPSKPITTISFDVDQDALTTQPYSSDFQVRDGAVLLHNLDTAPGSSGAPIYQQGRIVGYHLGALRASDPAADKFANVALVASKGMSNLPEEALPIAYDEEALRALAFAFSVVIFYYEYKDLIEAVQSEEIGLDPQEKSVNYLRRHFKVSEQYAGDRGAIRNLVKAALMRNITWRIESLNPFPVHQNSTLQTNEDGTFRLNVHLDLSPGGFMNYSIFGNYQIKIDFEPRLVQSKNDPTLAVIAGPDLEEISGKLFLTALDGTYSDSSGVDPVDDESRRELLKVLITDYDGKFLLKTPHPKQLSDGRQKMGGLQLFLPELRLTPQTVPYFSPIPWPKDESE